MNGFHEKIMRRCLQLAKTAKGNTYPNPYVGCVIVAKGKIIGEGYTSAAGGSHAEINAIKSVQNKELLQQATLYVSLEPCSHFGKTPPCSLAIIKNKIPTVVVGCLDENLTVKGKGIAMLQSNKVKVIFGVLEKECKAINQRFFNLQQHKKPFVILKWAQTANGYFAPKNKTQQWISNPPSKQLAHFWRTQEQSILVGTKTALVDNPKLNARLWHGNQPIKVVIDKELRVPSTHHIFESNQKLYIFNEKENHTKGHLCYKKINFTANLPKQILSALGKDQINSIIVEGGAKTLQIFIDASAWDEARIIQSQNNWQEGILAPKIQGKIIEEYMVQDNQVQILRRESQTSLKQ